MIDFNLDYLEWDYLGEGNLHIILKYIGNETEFKNKIIRI